MGAITEVYAHKKCEEAIKLEKQLRLGLFHFAGLLVEIKDKKLYEQEYGTWHAFLEHFHSLNSSSAYKMIQAYEFCQKYQLPEETVTEAGGYTVVYDYARKNPDASREKVVADMEMYATVGFAKSDIKSIINHPDCNHDTDYYIIRICRTCGKRIKEDDSKHNH